MESEATVLESEATVDAALEPVAGVVPMELAASVISTSGDAGAEEAGDGESTGGLSEAEAETGDEAEEEAGDEVEAGDEITEAVSPSGSRGRGGGVWERGVGGCEGAKSGTRAKTGTRAK